MPAKAIVKSVAKKPKHVTEYAKWKGAQKSYICFLEVDLGLVAGSAEYVEKMNIWLKGNKELI